MTKSNKITEYENKLNKNDKEENEIVQNMLTQKLKKYKENNRDHSYDICNNSQLTKNKNVLCKKAITSTYVNQKFYERKKEKNNYEKGTSGKNISKINNYNKIIFLRTKKHLEKYLTNKNFAKDNIYLNITSSSTTTHKTSLINSKSIEKRNRKPQIYDSIKTSELISKTRKKVNSINNHSKKKKDISIDVKERIYHHTKNNTI